MGKVEYGMEEWQTAGFIGQSVAVCWGLRRVLHDDLSYLSTYRLTTPMQHNWLGA